MNIDINVWDLLAKGIIGVLIAVFLPKQIFLCVREIILFSVTALVNTWKTVVFLSVVFFCFYYLFPYELIKSLYIVIALLSISVVSIIITFSKVYKRLSQKNSLVVYGCFSTRDKEYLVVDIDAESINEVVQKLCNEFNSTHFVFREHILRLQFITLPKFLPLILGYKGTKNLFEKLVQTRQISSLHFIRNVSDEQLMSSINFNIENFANAELLKDIQPLLNRISNEKRLSAKEVADISLGLFVLLFSQIFLDIILIDKQYKDAQIILDNSNNLLNDLKDGLLKKQIETTDASHFFNVWESYIDRYRAIMLFEQNELLGAVTYLIGSIKKNPYYPYFSYNTFKDNYVKRYGVELSYSIQDFSDSLEINNSNDFNKVRQRLIENTISPDMPYNHTLLLEIIEKDENGKTSKYIEQELFKIENNDAAIMLIKAEVIKYLPDGSEKINSIYSGRIDNVVQLLEEVVEKDNSFSVIHSKIGALLMNKAVLNANENEMKIAMEKWTRGMHFLTELGFNVNEKSS